MGRKIRFRDAKTLDNWKETLKQEMEYPVFVQYLFYSQWMKFKEYCNRKGVRLIGDIPIYVAPDSCDTWVNLKLFEYDEKVIQSECQDVRRTIFPKQDSFGEIRFIAGM